MSLYTKRSLNSLQRLQLYVRFCFLQNLRIGGVTCCLFFVIIFKIFLKNAYLCKYINYLYTVEITTTKKYKLWLTLK